MSPRYKTFVTRSRSVDMPNSCPPCVFPFRLVHCFAVQPRARASPRASVMLDEQAHNAKRLRTRSASTAFTTKRPPSGATVGLDEEVESWDIEVLKSPAHAPTANAFCERLIGSIRRECLDYVIPLSESHL